MSLFNRGRTLGSSINEIRCDEPSYLIWKWHPKGSLPGQNARENAIRWGSSLRVKDGEVAVFVYKQPNGTVQDYILGPFDKVLETNNLPVIANVLGLAYGGGTPFQAEIYFINLAQIVQVKFGVPFFDVYDPRFPDFGVPVAVRGTISFQITDCEQFIRLHRLTNFSLEDFRKQIRDAVCRYVKDTVTNAPAEHNIPMIQLESKIAFINDRVEFDIAERFKENFGVTVSAVDIGAIEIDKTSDSYAQLMSVTRTVAADIAQAQAQATMKNIQDKQRIEAENYGETLRIQREEGQYAQHKQTQTSNFAAYQVETQAQIGVAGANALGQMGANGTGGMYSSSFNPGVLMAGMAVAGAVGHNIAGTMNSIMSESSRQLPTAAVPPPVPTVAYYIAVNDQATGPYNLNTLKQMAMSGSFTSDTLVWKQGMVGWVNAGEAEGLGSMFSAASIAPPIG